ncbi:putative aromatic desulfoglucosinolate sulfotransferase [Helianthus anomalus]
MSTQSLLQSKEDEDLNNKHKHLIATIPRGNGWNIQHLYNYNGFWLAPVIIKSNLFLHTSFKSKPTDIYLASFMKSGTTWLKALMFSIINRDRYTFSDHYLLHHNPQSAFPFLDICDPVTNSEFSRPRLFSTHFPHTLLPPCITSCKLVYVCRDPKDVLVSKWHFLNKHRSENVPPLSLHEAFELFCEGVSHYGPVWEHVLSYWKASLESPEKILFLKYEEMMKQPAVEVRKLAAFMVKPFTDEEEEEGLVEKIVKLCSFENLRNLEVNKKGAEQFSTVVKVENHEFFRKGEIGDWKNYLSVEMKERIDGIMNDKLNGSGLVLGSSS